MKQFLFRRLSAGFSLKITSITLLFCCLFIGSTYAQNTTSVLDKKITIAQENVSIERILNQLEQQTGYTFSYSRSLIDVTKKTSISFHETPLKEILRALIGDLANGIRVRGNQILLQPQSGKGNVKGAIRTSDGKTAEFVTVSIKGTGKGTQTNENGEYSIRNINEGKQILLVQLVGHDPVETELDIIAEKTIEVPTMSITETSKTLQEIVVRGDLNRFTNKESEYVARLPIKNLENPQVYSVLSSRLIKAQISTDVQDVLRNATGAAVAAYPSGGFSVTTRGFASGVNARNGMEVGTGRSTIDIGNIERIEVLKGPSGTLFGANVSSFGGVVNLVTKKPFETAKTEISYTAGSFNLNRFSADMNLPLNEDRTVLLRVNGVLSRKNSFQSYGFSNDYQIAPSLSYQLNSRLSVLLDAEFTGTQRTLTSLLYVLPSSGFKSSKDIPIPYDASLSSNDIDSKSNSTRLFTQINYKISDNWQSTSLFSFSNQNVIKNHQPGITWYSPTEAARDVWVYGPIQENYINFQENINGQFSTGILKHKLLAGVNYRAMNSQFQYSYVRDWGYIDTINVAQNLYPLPITKAQADPFLVTEAGYRSPSFATWSAYVSDVISIADRFYAMLSLRVDRYKQQTVPSYKGFEQTSLSPKLGLVYQVIKDRISVFGNYMNGFQNQGPINQPNGVLFIPKPIYANQAEVGTKIETSGKKVNLTLSYYQIAIDNAVRYDTRNIALQDGSQLSTGFEAEISANPVAGLDIMAGYTYNYNRITMASDESVVGKQVAGMPKNVANFWINYTLQNKWKGIGFGFGGNYSDKAPYFSWNEYVTPSFTILNATAYYEQSRYRFGLKFNNLTNQKYWDLMGNSQQPFNIAGNITFKF